VPLQLVWGQVAKFAAVWFSSTPDFSPKICTSRKHQDQNGAA
jgi:hypothetical protein